MVVGKVIEIWRYPFKSMGGGMLSETTLGPLGIPGDRGWALRDEEAGEVRSAKKLPALMRCRARYVREPENGEIPPVEITLPDGTTVRSDAPEAAEKLSALIGRKATLWPRRPKEDLEHYRRHLPEDPSKLEGELREMFGRTEDEPLPDLSIFPRELLEFTSPLGTYFDAFPLHLLTTAWLDELGRRNTAARFDRRRFRPNLLIEPAVDATGYVEQEWVGKQVRIGEAVVDVRMPVVRCVMTTLPQEELAKDPSVLRTVVRDSAQNVGVYATVSRPGTVRAGDRVELL